MAPRVAASLLLLAVCGGAHASELGAPLLRNFAPAEYGGAVQNWAVVQDPRGMIYVGNVEDGVLEYDGIRWRRIPTTNRTSVRSLAVAQSGRVYVGGIGEIGYLAPDASGQTKYVSLLDRLPVEQRDFADVWRTFATSRGVYFSTFKRLIRIGDDGVKTWEAAQSFHLAFKVGDEIYVREAGRGLLRLVGQELVLVPRGEQFANEKIYAMLPWPGGSRQHARTLIGTRTTGWFLYDGRTLRPWRTEADEELTRDALYGAIWLADGSLAAATLRGGVFLLHRDGRLLRRIDKSSGLIDDTVFDVFQDRQGGMWLGLDKGIARVDVASPLTYFGAHSGIDGGVIASHRHAGTLFAGTTQGLYRLVDTPGKAVRFVAVPEVQGQTWAFLDWGDALLAGGVHGVYEIRDGSVRLVRHSEQATFSLLPSLRDSSRVFVGMHDGLASMRRENGQWIDEGRIPIPSVEVRTMFQETDGRLWLGTLTSGIVSVRFTGTEEVGPQASPVVERFGLREGLPLSPNYVYPVGGRPVFATTAGIFRFDSEHGRFAADPRFEKLFGAEPRQTFPIHEDAGGRVWMYTADPLHSIKEAGVAIAQDSWTFRWDSTPLRPLGSNSVTAIASDADGVLWLAGDDGLYRHDPGVAVNYRQPFTALVRRVANRDGELVFGGAGVAPTTALAYEENALRFEFAAPSFDNRPTLFQVYLEGVDDGWSAWSAESYRDYTYIPEGAYRFRVRAMNSFGTVSDEATYSFRIRAPWYGTWFAYAGYALLAILLLTGLPRWRSATLRVRNSALAKLVAERTEELSATNTALQAANAALAAQSITDTLTGLKNRRYLTEHIEPDVAAVRRAYNDRPAQAHANTDLVLMLIDVDHFKQVNDQYGHAAGDRVLQQFARILQGACREADTAVRWGGEEFMLLVRFADVRSGPVIAERIRSMAAAHTFTLDDGRTLRRTCSIGFASFPVLPLNPGRFSWEDAVKLADQCLYEAKRADRNSWVGVQGTDKRPTAEELREPVVIDLDHLLGQNYLRVVRPARPREQRAIA